jgi:hypothetical protein
MAEWWRAVIPLECSRLRDNLLDEDRGKGRERERKRGKIEKESGVGKTDREG